MLFLAELLTVGSSSWWNYCI